MTRFRRAIPMLTASWLAFLAPPAVAGVLQTIDFDTYPGGMPVPAGLSIGDQWKSLGVVFSDAQGGLVGASNNSCSLSPPNHAFANTIVATFVDPSTGSPALTSYAGTAQDNCWVPGEGIAMRAYGLDGQLLGSLFNPPGGSGGGHFEAFSFPSAVIARVEMDCVAQGIDNFAFAGPTVVAVEDRPLELRLAAPANPSSGGRLAVAFSLPSADAARLELVDAAGRRVASREVGGARTGVPSRASGRGPLPLFGALLPPAAPGVEGGLRAGDDPTVSARRHAPVERCKHPGIPSQ